MSTTTVIHHFSQIRIHRRHHYREAGKHLGFTRIKGTIISHTHLLVLLLG